MSIGEGRKVTEATARRPYAPRMAPPERREQILDAVLQVIVDQGIHKVSIDTVAKAAGVTRPVLYGHFADTEALLRASLEREEQAVLASLAPILPSVSDDPAAELLRFVDEFLQVVTAAPDRWRAVFALVDSSTPTYRRTIENGRRMLTSVLEEVIRPSAMESGLDSDLAARALFALIWDAGRTVLAEGGNFAPERVTTFARSVVDRLLG